MTFAMLESKAARNAIPSRCACEDCEPQFASCEPQRTISRGDRKRMTGSKLDIRSVIGRQVGSAREPWDLALIRFGIGDDRQPPNGIDAFVDSKDRDSLSALRGKEAIHHFERPDRGNERDPLRQRIEHALGVGIRFIFEAP